MAMALGNNSDDGEKATAQAGEGQHGHVAERCTGNANVEHVSGRKNRTSSRARMQALLEVATIRSRRSAGDAFPARHGRTGLHRSD